MLDRLGGNNASSASWVRSRSPVASSVNTVRMLSRRSQVRTGSGGSVPTSASRSGCSRGRTWPSVSVSAASTRLRMWQRRHSPATRRSPVPQPGHVFSSVESPPAHAAHNGAARVPARMRARFPHREHSARNRTQAPQCGCPVIFEVQHRALRPQIAHVVIVGAMQDSHTGPSGVRVETRRRRRQPTHSSRFVGSEATQYEHSRLPSASRLAGSRSFPQRAQMALWALAIQLRQLHSPSRRRCSRTNRPQCGHAGATILVAPAADSASISRNAA